MESRSLAGLRPELMGSHEVAYRHDLADRSI